MDVVYARDRVAAYLIDEEGGGGGGFAAALEPQDIVFDEPVLQLKLSLAVPDVPGIAILFKTYL